MLAEPTYEVDDFQMGDTCGRGLENQAEAKPELTSGTRSQLDHGLPIVENLQGRSTPGMNSDEGVDRPRGRAYVMTGKLE